MLQAQRVWETIPEQIRMGGPERTADYLADKDWSHVVAHSEGGSNAGSNGLWEKAGLNRARGAERMTTAEIEAAQQLAGSEPFQAALGEMANAAVKGGVAGAAVAAVLAVLEEALRFQRGELDEAGMWHAIGLRIAKAGIAGAAVAGLVTAIAMAFPTLLRVLAPLLVVLAVLGFAVYGKRLVKAGALDLKCLLPVSASFIWRKTGEDGPEDQRDALGGHVGSVGGPAQNCPTQVQGQPRPATLSSNFGRDWTARRSPRTSRGTCGTRALSRASWSTGGMTSTSPLPTGICLAARGSAHTASFDPTTIGVGGSFTDVYRAGVALQVQRLRAVDLRDAGAGRDGGPQAVRLILQGG